MANSSKISKITYKKTNNIKKNGRRPAAVGAEADAACDPVPARRSLRALQPRHAPVPPHDVGHDVRRADPLGRLPAAARAPVPGGARGRDRGVRLVDEAAGPQHRPVEDRLGGRQRGRGAGGLPHVPPARPRPAGRRGAAPPRRRRHGRRISPNFTGGSVCPMRSG